MSKSIDQSEEGVNLLIEALEALSLLCKTKEIEKETKKLSEKIVQLLRPTKNIESQILSLAGALIVFLEHLREMARNENKQ